MDREEDKTILKVAPVYEELDDVLRTIEKVIEFDGSHHPNFSYRFPFYDAQKGEILATNGCVLIVYRTEELKEHFGDTSGFLHFMESNIYVDFLVVNEVVENARDEFIQKMNRVRDTFEIAGEKDVKLKGFNYSDVAFTVGLSKVLAENKVNVNLKLILEIADLAGLFDSVQLSPKCFDDNTTEVPTPIRLVGKDIECYIMPFLLSIKDETAEFGKSAK